MYFLCSREFKILFFCVHLSPVQVRCREQRPIDNVLVIVTGATWPEVVRRRRSRTPSPPPCFNRSDRRAHKQAWLSPPASSSSSSFIPRLLPRFPFTPNTPSFSTPPAAHLLPPCCGYAAGGEPEEADSGRRPFSTGGHQFGKPRPLFQPSLA